MTGITKSVDEDILKVFLCYYIKFETKYLRMDRIKEMEDSF